MSLPFADQFLNLRNPQIFALTTTLETGHWNLAPVTRLNHTDTSREDGANVSASVTCILPMPHNVYTGDEDGRVVRSSFLDLDKWVSRKVGWDGQVEWRGGRDTKVDFGDVAAAKEKDWS
jgi:beige protein homolog 1